MATQFVTPGGFTPQAFGTPTIAGSSQSLIVGGFSPQQFGIPTVTGGPTHLRILLGGVDIPFPAAALALGAGDPTPGSQGGGSAPTITSQTIGRWQAQFDIFDASGTFAPSLGGTVIFFENNLKLFAGCLVSVVAEYLMGTTQDIIYHCTAADKSSICDHRVVQSAMFSAGSDVSQAVLSIVSQYLNGEGITTQGVPVGLLGTFNSDQIFNYTTVTQAFDAIATDSGTIWFIDVNGVLNFSAFVSLPAAPFNLTATSGNFRGFSYEQTTLNFRNTQYAVSNLSIVPTGNTPGIVETFTWTIGQPGIVTGYLAGGVPFAFACHVANPISSILSITVNGDPQTVVDFANFHGQTSTGPTDHVFFYAQQDTQVSSTQQLPITPGSTVIITYVPFTSNSGQQVGTALAPVSPITGGTSGTCGSGIYEAVEQVQNISSLADLNAIAQAVLSRFDTVPTVIRFQTDKAGLAPGQLINVDLPLISPIYLTAADFLITQVSGVSVGFPLEFGNSFQWDVSASSVLDLGNWIKWFENLVKRTQNALPVYQFEIAAFVLGPGSSISGGLIDTNPYIVKRTGLLFDMYASATTPPVDQNLILEFFVNGTLIPGSVVIPAGSTPQAQFRFTFTNPMYVFAGTSSNDIITVQATYQVTGGSPVAASNVSYDIRWRI